MARRRPEPVENSAYVTWADTILMKAIGQDVDAGVLNEAHLTTNRWGHIDIDQATMATNLQGVFAGGVATGAAAVGRGRRGGSQGRLRDPCLFGRSHREEIAAAVARPVPKFFDIGATALPSPRAEMPVLDKQARIAAFRGSLHVGRDGDQGAFAEVELGLDDEAAHERKSAACSASARRPGVARCSKMR